MKKSEMPAVGRSGKKPFCPDTTSPPIRTVNGPLAVSRPVMRSWPWSKLDAAISKADADRGNNGGHSGLANDTLISVKLSRLSDERQVSESIPQLSPAGVTSDDISISLAES